MNRKIVRIVLSTLLILSVSFIFAQTPGAPNRTPPPPPGIPIDGGLIALFSVAIGYAVRKLKLKK